MIRIMRGGRCDLCDGPIEKGYELHEVSDNCWAVVCDPCVDATGMNEGK